MKKTLFLLLLAVISLFPACKKSHEEDPCKGLAWMTAPITVGIIFLDKETGENILLKKNIDTSKITVTLTGKETFKRQVRVSSLGTMNFMIEQNNKGSYKYTINISGVGTTTLSYTNEEKVTNSPCHPISIVVKEPVIAEYPYTVERVSTSYLFTVKI